MGVVDLVAWNDALNIHYVDDRLYNLADIDCPTLGTIAKDTKATGRSLSQRLMWQMAGGGSADLAQSVTDSLESKVDEFDGIKRAKVYEVAILDNETIEASADDRDAVASAIDEIDRKLKAASQRVEAKLFRGRGGWIGRVKAGTALNSTTLTLDDAADAFNFFKGQTIQFATTDGTSGSVLAGGPMTVASVQREAGTVTFTAQVDTTLTGETDTMYLFKNGDFGKGMIGFLDWVPIDRSGLATPFFTVTRSDDPDRLAGLYRDCRGEPLFDSLIKMVGTLGKHGITADYAMMNPDVMTDLILSAQGKTLIENTQVPSNRTQTIGYDTFKIRVGSAMVTIKTSWACPMKAMWVGKWSSWKLRSLGSMPKFLNRTGIIHQSENADTYQARVGGYGNLFCAAPGENIVGQLI